MFRFMKLNIIWDKYIEIINKFAVLLFYRALTVLKMALVNFRLMKVPNELAKYYRQLQKQNWWIITLLKKLFLITSVYNNRKMTSLYKCIYYINYVNIEKKKLFVCMKQWKSCQIHVIFFSFAKAIFWISLKPLWRESDRF